MMVTWPCPVGPPGVKQSPLQHPTIRQIQENKLSGLMSRLM
jgi:hypothetical protein